MGFIVSQMFGKQLFQPLKRKLAGNETRRAECSLLPGNWLKERPFCARLLKCDAELIRGWWYQARLRESGIKNSSPGGHILPDPNLDVGPARNYFSCGEKKNMFDSVLSEVARITYPCKLLNSLWRI